MLGPNNFFYNKLYVFFIVLIFNMISIQDVFSQIQTDLPESLGRSLGVYKINLNEIPKKFENFEYFQLKEFPNQDTDNPTKDWNSRVFVDGEIKTKDAVKFKFKKGFIKTIERRGNRFYRDVIFKTIIINGVCYEFKGMFLEHSVLNNGQYTKIKGQLTKFRNGKKVGSVDIPFYEFAEL